MNYALILSGGTGTRMRTDGFPKQYIEVQGKPILFYTLEQFEKNLMVDKIVVVATDDWKEQIERWLRQYDIKKFDRIAKAGNSRQESIVNGLEACVCSSENAADRVIIHDAVRPLVSDNLISSCLRELEKHDGCMPVLAVKDTIYHSKDGKAISDLLCRKTLFAGQAPEAYWLHLYLRINRGLKKDELANVYGTSEIAYRNGLDIRLIPGEELNFKLTTPADLERFQAIIKGKI